MSGNLAPGNAFVAIGAGTKLHLIYKSYTNLTTLSHSHTHTYPYIHRGGRTQIAHMHTQLATQVNLSKAVDLTGLSLSSGSCGSWGQNFGQKGTRANEFLLAYEIFTHTRTSTPLSPLLSVCVCADVSIWWITWTTTIRGDSGLVRRASSNSSSSQQLFKVERIKPTHNTSKKEREIEREEREPGYLIVMMRMSAKDK